MDNNKKIKIILILVYFLASSIFTYGSLKFIKTNQEKGTTLYRKEILELARESADKNSKLFFSSIDQRSKSAETGQDLLNYVLEAYSLSIDDIVVIDIASRNVMINFGKQNITSMVSKSNTEEFLRENILSEKKNFDKDNFTEYEKDTTGKIIPTKINFRVYKDFGIIVGLGENYTTEKARMEYLQRENQKNFKIQLYSTVFAYVIFSIIILSIVIIAGRRSKLENYEVLENK